MHGANEKAVTETIAICKDKGILEEFLRKMEQEVARVVVDLFNEEWYIRDLKIDASEERAVETAKRMLEDKENKLSIEKIAQYTGLDIDVVEKLATEMPKEKQA